MKVEDPFNILGALPDDVARGIVSFFESDNMEVMMEDANFRRNIADEVKKMRTKAGLSQKNLAQKLHTQQSAISRLESGFGHCSTRTLSMIGAATGHKLLVMTFDQKPKSAEVRGVSATVENKWLPGV